MSIYVDATIEGEVQLARRLQVVDTGISDFRQPLESSVTELKHSFDENFAASGGLFGGWAPRAKSYPWPILDKTGDMRHSFDAIVQDDMAMIFNTAEYFKYHQSRAPRRKLPRRVMMMIDNKRKQFIQKAFQQYNNDIINRSK